MLGLFAQQLGIGLVVGVAIGWLAREAFQRVRLSSPGPLPGRLARDGGARVRRRGRRSRGSGFLAVYLAGLALGSANIPAKRTVTAFHEGLAWVAQLTMFLTLGLLVFPAELDEVAWRGTLLALVVVFVSRPLATAARHARQPASACARRACSAGPGCAARCPSCSRLFPVIEGVPAVARRSSTSSSSRCCSRPCCRARRSTPSRAGSGVTSDEPLPPGLDRSRSARCASSAPTSSSTSIRPGDAAAGARLRDLGLPRDALVSLIVRGDEALLPRGSTRLEPGDRLLVLVRREVAHELPELLERWRTGPVAQAGPPAAHLHAAACPVYTARPWSDAGRRPGAPARGGRQRRRRAPAHAPRRPRRARDPRRRPLRGHGPDPDDGAARAGPGPGAPPPGQGARRRRASRGGRRSSAPARCERARRASAAELDHDLDVVLLALERLAPAVERDAARDQALQPGVVGLARGPPPPPRSGGGSR